MSTRDRIVGAVKWAVSSAAMVSLVAAAGAVAVADPPAPGGSGIEVVGPADAWPQQWTATDKASGKVAAKVTGKWGAASLPPGEYALAVLPRGHEPVEVAWGDVRVEDAKVSRVELTAGVEVVGRDAQDSVLEHWDLFEPATGKKVVHTWQRWGFAPLPPGTYAMRIRPRGHESVEIPWAAEVLVEAGKATKVAIDTGVEAVGRDGEDRVLEHWDVVDKATGENAAHTWQRWGFTPLVPGAYSVRVRPRGHESVDVVWGDVVVEKGRATPVDMRSGVDLSPRAEGEETLEHWDVVERAGGAQVAHVWQRWGFTPLPPGAYAVRIRPLGQEAIDVVWGDADVTAGNAVPLQVASGIHVAGRPGQDPPEHWFVHDASTRTPVARVYRRFGFTPLPPGTYDVERIPRRWPAVEVKAGQVVSLEEPDAASRWALVSGAGRKTEKERDPAGYKKLEEEIERSIRRAAAWLTTQSPIAHMDPKESDGHPAIGILALVHAGELDRDPALARRCRDYLMRRALNDSYGTYVSAVTAMALTDMGALRNRSRIFDCATWLVENQGWEGDEKRVWGYGDPLPGFDAKPAADAGGRGREAPRPTEVVRSGLAVNPGTGWDNSNAQFGVLGLHSAARARVGLPRKSWERIESHFRKYQGGDGSWGYTSGNPTGSMTCAGVASLVLARHHLGTPKPAVDPAVLDGLEWLDWKFTLEENPGSSSHHYYYLYGLERVGVLSGIEFLGEHEWYPLGARYLLSKQEATGAWGGPEPFLNTCYAILFLRRATLPLEAELPALVSVTRDETAMRRDMPAVELILDSSGSMKDPVEGRPKMDLARAVITEVLSALPAEMQVGLRLYGHKHPPEKTDTELVVPIGPLDENRRRTIQGWIDRAQPRGWTPMVHSLLQAKNDFAAAGKGSRTVVLVSDGEETGGGKVEDVEAAYRTAGIEVVIHVVGFDIQGVPLAQQQLQEIARIGKGRYYAARGAKELSHALREAMPSPGFEVLDAGGAVAARGGFNGDPVEVKPGKYRVRLSGSGVEGVELTLEAGQDVVLRVDEAGKLVPGGS